MAIVDLDDQESWPAGVADLAHGEARRLAGTTEHYTDLRVVQDHDLLADLSGHKLRAFHSTRLLDVEVSAIRETGLVALSEDLITTRLGYAVAAGALSPEAAEVIASEHLLNDLDGRGAYRVGQVCFVSGKSVFVDDVDGLSPLLGHWGGEAIYFAYHEKDPRALRLRRIGQPAVVVAHLDLSVGGIHDYQVDRLLKAFVGRVLKLGCVAPEFHYFANVPSGDIEDILRPGDADYAALGDMPSA
ncbi:MULTISPECIES: hypothetical protein [Kribbella]|uniref:hypothetical protein n=1 Tax=Kribbella TaxID=182639 RepID=UPI0010521DE7|nr:MULTISPECIES: hypothetical protein [Kribbella]